MSFLEWLFRNAFPPKYPPSAVKRLNPEESDWMMMPPATLVDPMPWDRYWRELSESGCAGLVDLFCNDGELIDAMRSAGLRTVLCVGSGISQEPRALAWAGLDVTVLDLSPAAAKIAEHEIAPPDVLSELIGHRSPAPPGELIFVTGNLLDASVCPGPFDVVIERRTLQLFPKDERAGAIQAVADRLGSPGVFVSHCHDGGWRPPGRPHHATETWFDAHAWPRWTGEATVGRVVWLQTTTG